MSVLDQILAHNAGAAAELRPDDNHASSRLCVVTCSDPSVTALLPRAVGLGPEELVLVRLPGPAIRSGSEELCRAVATAVALNGCDEVLVVAHTACVLVATQASAAASALATRGLDRARLPEDVRTFFNLQASSRQIAMETASAIRSAGYLPAGLLVHAALLDNASAKLTVLERGEHLASSAARPEGGLFGASGPAELGGGLPAGLGVGATGFGASSAGPLELAVELPPHVPIGVSALDLPRTELASSGIELKASGIDIEPSPLDFGPSAIEIRSAQIDLRPSVDLQASSLAVASGPIDLRLSPLDFEPAALGGPPSTRGAAPPPLPSSRPASSAPPSPKRAPARAASRAAPRATAQSRPAPPREQPVARPAASRAPAPPPRLPAGLLPKVDKVRDFYRIELEPAVRAEVARALGAAALSGLSNAELIKLAFRPVLESGPKRYKVIDELLAIKEAASTMDREACHSVLRQLVQ